MPIQHRSAQFGTKIIAIAPLRSGRIGVATADHTVYVFDPTANTYDKVVAFNLKSDKTLLFAFDPVQERFLFADTAGTILYLVDIGQKRVLGKFELGRQSPTRIAFTPDGSHFVCGTSNGRVLLWRSDANTPVARLHSFPEYSVLYTRPKTNYVSACAFQGDWLATSGYGGSVVVTDYTTHRSTHRFSLGNVRTNAVAFYRHFLLIGREDGTLMKIDRRGKLPNHRLGTSQGSIHTLLPIGSGPYMLAASEKTFLFLIDVESMKILDEPYLQTEHPITALCPGTEGSIYVATADGELLCYDLQPTEELERLIAAGNYAQAYRMCLDEPLLGESPQYGRLDAIFETAKTQALEALDKGDIETAKNRLNPFGAAKAKEIGTILKAFTQMPQFAYLYEKRKFSPFYGLAEQYPILQTTRLYRKVEQLWAEQFVKAQKLALANRRKEAIEYLAPFSTVNAKRPFILLLTQHPDLLKVYSQAIHRKDFSQLHTLIQHNPIFRTFPSYLQLIEQAGALPDAITQALDERKFEYADLLIGRLGDIPGYEEHCREFKYFAASASKLDHALRNEQWRTAYQILDTHPDLIALPWAAGLENAWQEKILACERYAAQGEIEAIKRELGNLITLPNRLARIGDILRMGYLVQLKTFIGPSAAAFAEGVERYCDLFGMDTELWQVVESAQASGIEVSLDATQLIPKKREHWTTSSRRLPDRISG